MRNLYITTYLASYRSDLYEALFKTLSCEVFYYEEAEIPLGSDLTFCPRRLPVRRLLGRPMVKGLVPILKQYRPEYVFVQEFSLTTLWLLGLRRKFGFKLISFCDDSLDMISGNDFRRLHTLARRFLPRLLDNLILHSPEVCQWYRCRFSKGIVLPIVADNTRYRKRLEECLPASRLLRDEQGVGNRRIVLFVGRLVALKNIPLLLDAFRRMGQDDVTLVIVGDGECRQVWESQSCGLDVRFTGMLDEKGVLAWYNLADLLVLPSYREAFGAVVGEALLAGCPVLVSGKAGARSLIRPGINGDVFQDRSVDELTRLMQKWLSAVHPGRELILRDNLLDVSFQECFRKMKESI